MSEIRNVPSPVSFSFTGPDMMSFVPVTVEAAPAPKAQTMTSSARASAASSRPATTKKTSPAAPQAVPAPVAKEPSPANQDDLDF